MSNTQLITFTVSVDVDRKSSRYGEKAVLALDPTRRGTGVPLKNTDEADRAISKTVALELIKYLLSRRSLESFGRTTVSVISPKNIEAIEETLEPEFGDDYGD